MRFNSCLSKPSCSHHPLPSYHAPQKRKWSYMIGQCFAISPLISLVFYPNPVKLSLPFWMCRNWGSERFSNCPRTLIWAVTDSLLNPVCWLQNQCPINFFILSGPCDFIFIWVELPEPGSWSWILEVRKAHFISAFLIVFNFFKKACLY